MTGSSNDRWTNEIRTRTKRIRKGVPKFTLSLQKLV